ncbi:isopeptide-forming domain-containing fimbrial protein [Bacillus paranthracis]|uniref:isopeptide-forming domain-containing fimbrial protein n=1 Tax=Bacillus paranthracis TaxID=2026186 RepID=UPI0018794595|nr:isopeptide-forming domain-containing fimbrial protein [Bacillus paranthracis]MBE7144707.1 isopeptide-forming domain-containing fimbrial protein [Bacillus paranthracis]
MKKNVIPLLILLLLFQIVSPWMVAFANNTVEAIEHKVTTKSTGNMCLREHEGELSFQWPRNKKKVDLVIVQDASGSFKDTIGSVKSALNKIIDQLDHQTDRVMVTSYQDYRGFKDSKGNTLWGANGPGIKTILQAQLSNSFSSAKNGVNRIEPNSGTPTASGLQFALNEYEKAKGQPDSNREVIFLLITDGVANVRKDGYIYKLTNQITDRVDRYYTSSEYGQDYMGALKEVTGEAQKVKNAGYKLVTAFWEDKDSLAAPTQYYDKYEREVGPYARQELKKMATNPEWFVLANNIEEFTKNLIETVTKVTKKEKDKMILNVNNDLKVEDVKVFGPKGSNAKPVLQENQLVLDLEGQPEGAYKVIYKVKETKPQPKEFNVANGYFISSDQKIDIPVAKASPSENAEKCITAVTKKVSDSDQKMLDEALLNSLHEEFVYDVNYNFGFDVEAKQEIAIQDDLEDILEILDTNVVNEKGEVVNVTPVIDKEKAIVTYKLPKQNDSYAYLAGGKYHLKVKARIKTGTNIDVIKSYLDKGGVPNSAKLILDNNPLISNKVVVKPPIEEPKLHKTVSDDDEKNVEKATLSNVKEKFSWNVRYEFGSAPSGYDSIVLQDDLEDILAIVDVKVVNKKGEAVNVKPKIDAIKKQVVIEVPKKEGSYEYLTDEVYTMHITSKIADGVKQSELARYIVNGGIPNTAELVINNKSVKSNEVYVIPPKEKPKVIKTVSTQNEKEVEKAVLQAQNEEFTWNVEYQFGNDTTKLEKVTLQDDLEDILEVLDVKLMNEKGEEVKITPKIDEQTKKVTIDLEKKDGSYSYLAGLKYTMHIKSKIVEGTSAEVLVKYIAKGGIPNIAELVFDNKPTSSNEVVIIPPSIGKIEIEKVDAEDENVKLQHAEFLVFNQEGKEIGKLTTDESGKATLEELAFGKYTIKEVKAPDGYMLLRDPIEVEVTASTPTQKIKVENRKSEWEIPNTGGVGTNVFYLIGAFLMLVILLVFFHKQNSNN